MDSSSDDDRVEGPLPVIPYRLVGGGPLLRYSLAMQGRSCPCRARYSYPNRLVLRVDEEWRQLTREFRIVRAEIEKMEGTMEAQAARIQKLEVRVLEKCQRADAPRAQFQETEGHLIRIVQEAGNQVDGIMVKCVTMADRLKEALFGDILGETVPIEKVEVEPIEEDPEKNPEEDPSEPVGSSSSINLY